MAQEELIAVIMALANGRSFNPGQIQKLFFLD